MKHFTKSSTMVVGMYSKSLHPSNSIGKKSQFDSANDLPIKLENVEVSILNPFVKYAGKVVLTIPGEASYFLDRGFILGFSLADYGFHHGSPDSMLEALRFMLLSLKISKRAGIKAFKGLL
ncbi:120aa long hypothetical protein [Pyrococcus horikoshii OT3]|uniref:Uncharacterized protein n=1 Tax=Pyrococcus horikoshii (strain ATCC 700860 / DSM 12428 / JCM 9974 / NBRC 100139 / OT-3) TaxID=70601 RepID=O58425_PYRHO|nr:120aa long hypothetical protein [Pyrococcus horikoshii OT3]